MACRDHGTEQQWGKDVITEALCVERGTIGFTSNATLDESRETRQRTRMAVARAKERDHDALRYLYIRYSHNVYGYVRPIVRDDHEAEDVTQQVFAKLMTAIGKYDDRGVPFAGWLLRLARNLAIDHLRANRLTPVDEMISSDCTTGIDLDGPWAGACTRSMVAPPRSTRSLRGVAASRQRPADPRCTSGPGGLERHPLTSG